MKSIQMPTTRWVNYDWGFRVSSFGGCNGPTLSFTRSQLNENPRADDYSKQFAVYSKKELFHPEVVGVSWTRRRGGR